MNTIGDAAAFFSGGTPKKTNGAFWGGDIPWFSAANMSGKFLAKSDLNITKQGLNAGSRIAPAGSTLLLVRGSGLFNHIPICFADRDIAFNQDVKAIVARDGVDPLYLHYTLEAHRRELENNVGVTGIGAGKFDTAFLKQLSFVHRDRGEQKEIGRLASAYDRKIDLNRRMNETLEEMARALFRDWFVDFGPTRRQMDGATDPVAIMGQAFPPEKAANLAQLFPNRLGDDGLPEGWVSKALGERVTVKRGGSPRPIKDFIRPTGIPWVKIADATRCDGPNLFVTREFIKEEGLKKTVELQPGSLILSNSATPGLPKFLRLRACIHDGWLYFPDTGGLSIEFLYLAFLHFKDVIVSQATGSVFNNLKTEVLKRQKFVFPPPELLTKFDTVVGPLFNKILSNEKENRTLAEMRDLFLPKLMSGEIRLKDVEATE